MEKDEHPIPLIQLEEHVPTAAGYPHQYKGSELIHSTRGNMVAAGMPEENFPRSFSSGRVFHSRSGDPASHSKFSTNATPSPNSAASSYTHASIPSTISSLGYVSEDPSDLGRPSLMRSSAPDLHYYSPRSKGSLGTLSSGEGAELSSSWSGYSSSSVQPYIQKSLSQESAENIMRVQQSSMRPTSLVLPNTGGGASHAQQAQQFFSCPNCKRTFSCTSGNTFEPWFDHIKVCSVQGQ